MSKYKLKIYDSIFLFHIINFVNESYLLEDQNYLK